MIRRLLVRSGRRGGGAAALLVVALLTLALAPPAVAAPGTGSVSGTVIGEGGAGPLADVHVTAFDPVGYEDSSTDTDAAGHYELDLEPGTFRIAFDPPNGSPWSPQVWESVPGLQEGTDVVVTPGSSAVADATLVVGSTITGRVTCGGVPTGGIDVGAYPERAQQSGRGATTLGDGSYRITGVAPGETTVLFSIFTGDCISEFWDDVPYGELPTPFTVVAGEDIGGIDADLTLGGSISGTITTAGSAATLGQVLVLPVSAAPALEPLVGGTPAYSGEGGGYVVRALPPGDYLVEYDAREGSRDQWYPDAVTSAGAVPLHVSSGAATTGIDFSAIPGATISGTVGGAYPPDSSSVPVTTTLIGAPPSEGIDSVLAAEDGSYSIANLAEGEYLVSVGSQRDEAFDATTARQWYQDASSASSATPVPVEGAATSGGVDFFLVPDASISGTVTAVDEQGQRSPLVAPVEVRVLEKTADGWLPIEGPYVGASVDPTDGSYTVDGLGAGVYRIEFFGYADAPQTPYYGTAIGRTQGPAGSRDITVGVGGTVTGVDGVVAPAGAVVTPDPEPPVSALADALRRLGVALDDPRLAAACAVTSAEALQRLIDRFGVVVADATVDRERSAVCPEAGVRSRLSASASTETPASTETSASTEGERP